MQVKKKKKKKVEEKQNMAVSAKVTCDVIAEHAAVR
jgi:hypothetical protein